MNERMKNEGHKGNGYDYIIQVLLFCLFWQSLALGLCNTKQINLLNHSEQGIILK